MHLHVSNSQGPVLLSPIQLKKKAKSKKKRKKRKKERSGILIRPNVPNYFNWPVKSHIHPSTRTVPLSLKHTGKFVILPKHQR